jgi:hypothetical protein
MSNSARAKSKRIKRAHKSKQERSIMASQHAGDNFTPMNTLKKKTARGTMPINDFIAKYGPSQLLARD